MRQCLCCRQPPCKSRPMCWCLVLAHQNSPAWRCWTSSRGFSSTWNLKVVWFISLLVCVCVCTALHLLWLVRCAHVGRLAENGRTFRDLRYVAKVGDKNHRREDPDKTAIRWLNKQPRTVTVLHFFTVGTKYQRKLLLFLTVIFGTPQTWWFVFYQHPNIRCPKYFFCRVPLS